MLGGLGRQRAVIASAWLVAGAVTALHLAWPDLLSVQSPSSTAVLETGATLAASLIAYLSYGRWRLSARLDDLLACYAVGVLALSNLSFGVLPLMFDSLDQTRTVHAAAVIAGLTAALLLTMAAWVPPRRAEPSRRPVRDALGVMLAVVIVAASISRLGSLLGDHIRLTGEPSSAEAIRRPADEILTALQLATAATFTAAAAGFLRRRADRFPLWLGLGVLLWAFSRVNYAITPERLATTVTVGDWLRLSAYVVLVAGVAAEIRAYWRHSAEKAVLEERQRIARELHDGLAQELAFIAGQSVVLARRDAAPQRVHLLRGAAERALDESRRAIAALSRPLDEPLDVALAQSAEEVAARLGARVHLNLESGVRVDHDDREALIRITREAVTNAVRHGRAGRVSVSLANHHGVTLVVADDGRGFDPHEVHHLSGRLGIESMRARAKAAGGTLEIATRPYAGTRVTVRLP